MAHPIAAIATGFVRSGIGILRMSGDGCIDLANKVFSLSSKKPMSELPDRLLSRGTLYDEQSRPIDEAMVLVPARRTPTPEKTRLNFSATALPPFCARGFPRFYRSASGRQDPASLPSARF